MSVCSNIRIPNTELANFQVFLLKNRLKTQNEGSKTSKTNNFEILDIWINLPTDRQTDYRNLGCLSNTFQLFF